jgi:hypothetical protein
MQKRDRRAYRAETGLTDMVKGSHKAETHGSGKEEKKHGKGCVQWSLKCRLLYIHSKGYI